MLQAAKQKTKQIGKVITEVTIISVIIFLFIPFFKDKLPPTSDMLLTFPELIGIPRSEQISNVKKELKSEKKARGVSHFSIDLDKELIIRLPPKSVENDIIDETDKIKKRFDPLALTPANASIIPMNFWPSCAPCINESAPDEARSILLYGKFLFLRAFAHMYEIKNDRTQENTIKSKIFEKRTRNVRLNLPKARDAPPRAAISAWLSLDGIPKSQATMPNSMTVKKQQKQAMLDEISLSNIRRENMLSVTFLLPRENTRTPKKLKTADKRAPCQSLRVLEATIEKIELGASVQPLTKTTKPARNSVEALKKSLTLI